MDKTHILERKQSEYVIMYIYSKIIRIEPLFNFSMQFFFSYFVLILYFIFSYVPFQEKYSKIMYAVQEASEHGKTGADCADKYPW
jgi:hypothetical protein